MATEIVEVDTDGGGQHDSALVKRHSGRYFY
jgi:hypothetical protein